VTVAVHLPLSPSGKRFCQLFYHRFNFIEAKTNKSGRPEWRTESRYPIEHRNLWKRYQSPDTLIGVSFGEKTRYALLDIDRGSPYHPSNNEQRFKELLGAYEDVGINELITLQSSWSEGLHIYLAFPKELPTYKLAVMLKLTAIRSGFKVKGGELEIFPNTKSYNKAHPTPYKAHRLPLQEGSFLLDRNLDPYSNSIKEFLDLAEKAALAQDIDLIEAALEAAYKTKGFRHIKGNGAKAAQFAQDLKEQIEEGWTGFGQTNDLLRVIGTYGRVFEALEGKRLANYIATTAQTLPGYREYCRHQHNIETRARDWGRCIEKFYYPYGTKPTRAGKFAEMKRKGEKENPVNSQRQKKAVERIKVAVEYVLETIQEIPQKIGEMQKMLQTIIKEQFGVRASDKTLRKYRNEWYPQLVREKPQKEAKKSPEKVYETEPDPWETEKEESHNRVQPEPLPGGEERIGPTPPDVVRETESPEKALKPLAEKGLEELAPPPPYMKVIAPAQEPGLNPGPSSKNLITTTKPASSGEKQENFAQNPVEPLEKDLILLKKLDKIYLELRKAELSLTSEGCNSLTVFYRAISYLRDQIADWQGRKTHHERNLDYFRLQGFPLFDGLLQFGEELTRELEEIEGEIEEKLVLPLQNLQSSVPSAPPQPVSPHQTDSQTPPQTEREPIPSNSPPVNPINPQNLKIESQNSCQPGAAPESVATPVPQPRQKKPLELLNRCRELGVALNKTVERLIHSKPEEIILDALEALQEQNRQGKVHNPAGFLVKAIQEHWKSSQSEEKLPLGGTVISPEFLQWYEQAIAAGIVENVPLNWLGSDRYGEPWVRVKPPLGEAPYTLIVWHEVRELTFSSTKK
jgi:regulator of replication initiation timing